ncbi:MULTISPECIES: metallophosphoesterase family protein [Flavobacteriaceae]|uniref:metallophosphoesterase family protein n=1 Tax=Flavobacteriaceae TaxID=49546 RepID=UPI002349B2A7|nr:metallophosphoesterase [Muricauda sp. SP22]MDC6362556.1 metallophosphoesterase [Muricauda sp. SP22]
MNAKNSVESTSINIAIISDLHCHHSSHPLGINSHLLTDSLRNPAAEHPIQSFIEQVIPDFKENIDYLFCPGDITNGTDPQGLISGWDFINEIAHEMSTKDVIATIGNHDIDSRQQISKDEVFRVPKKIGKSYPFKSKELRDEYWANGYCFVEFPDVRVLVINSCHFHRSKDTAVQGKVDKAQIEEIKKYVEKREDSKIQVALCHHHPMEYPLPNPQAEDVLENSADLLKGLIESNFDVFVHGHKHYPSLEYHPCGGKRIPILSSGSFSAKSGLMMHGMFNSFHMMTITKTGNNQAVGKIRTWEYLEGNGWRRANGGPPNLPSYTGFGSNKNIKDICLEINQLYQSKNSVEIRWDKIEVEIPEVQYLTPKELVDLEKTLDDIYELEVNYSKERLPSKIGKKYNPNEDENR